VSTTKLRAESIIEAWRQLEADSLGSLELESIRFALAREFGEGATPSPAVIARTLAEYGVRLRHAEVLSVDTRWRTRRFNELFGPDELNFESIKSALDSMEKLDELLIHFNSEGDLGGQASLRQFAVDLKSELQSVAQARIKLGMEQEVAAEVGEWLTIWLQTPHIFTDWLEIRRRSESFRQKFESSTKDSENVR
jgi:hypothetical protein